MKGDQSAEDWSVVSFEQKRDADTFFENHGAGSIPVNAKGKRVLPPNVLQWWIPRVADFSKWRKGSFPVMTMNGGLLDQDSILRARRRRRHYSRR